MTISGWVEFHRLIYKVKLKWIIDSRYSKAPIIQNNPGGFPTSEHFQQRTATRVMLLWCKFALLSAFS